MNGHAWLRAALTAAAAVYLMFAHPPAGLGFLYGILCTLCVLAPARPRRRAPSPPRQPGIILPQRMLVVSREQAAPGVTVLDADPVKLRQLEKDTSRPLAGVIADAERKAERLHLASLPPLTGPGREEQLLAEIEFAKPGEQCALRAEPLAALMERRRRAERMILRLAGDDARHAAELTAEKHAQMRAAEAVLRGDPWPGQARQIARTLGIRVP